MYLLPQPRKPPAAYQGSIFKHGPEPVANIKPLETRRDSQSNRLELLKAFDEAAEERLEPIDPLDLASLNCSWSVVCRLRLNKRFSQLGSPRRLTIIRYSRIAVSLFRASRAATSAVHPVAMAVPSKPRDEP